MWFLASASPVVPAQAETRIGASILIALVGVAFDIAALLAFRKASTTINPLRPEKSSALVTGGVYRLSRNPMYVGLLLFLVAWAAYLASPLALAGPVSFVLYIQRFQILPEERILAAIFGGEYDAYRARVRRWL
jgi:protein-S-isoprenylcysteine O-methyltransferase Ste14